MFFSPFTLQIYAPGTTDVDNDGNPITTPGGYRDLCPCRCDDNRAQKSIGFSGEAHIYNHHIVFSKTDHQFKIGDKVRVLTDCGTVRCEGAVLVPATLNYLNYQELYI